MQDQKFTVHISTPNDMVDLIDVIRQGGEQIAEKLRTHGVTVDLFDADGNMLTGYHYDSGSEPAAVPEPSPRRYTRDRVSDALNDARNAIDNAANLPDTGARDAMNLLVNATMDLLDEAGKNLAAIVEDNYGMADEEELQEGRTKLDVVLGWIES